MAGVQRHLLGQKAFRARLPFDPASAVVRAIAVAGFATAKIDATQTRGQEKPLAPTVVGVRGVAAHATIG